MITSQTHTSWFRHKKLFVLLLIMAASFRVGDCVNAYFSKDRQWFAGVVESVSNGNVTVHFDIDDTSDVWTAREVEKGYLCHADLPASQLALFASQNSSGVPSQYSGWSQSSPFSHPDAGEQNNSSDEDFFVSSGVVQEEILEDRDFLRRMDHEQVRGGRRTTLTELEDVNLAPLPDEVLRGPLSREDYDAQEAAREQQRRRIGDSQQDQDLLQLAEMFLVQQPATRGQGARESIDPLAVRHAATISHLMTRFGSSPDLWPSARQDTYLLDPEDVLHHCGAMDSICQYCGALFWIDERLSGSPLHNPVYSRCCHQGRVRLPPLPSAPPAVRALLNDRGERDQIRAYNDALSFCSLGVEYDPTVHNAGGAPPVFKVNHNVHHYIGPLTPPPGKSKQWAQIWFLDPLAQAQAREYFRPNLSPVHLQSLQDMLAVSCPFVSEFQQVRLQHNVTPDTVFEVRLYDDIGAPTVQQEMQSAVAAVVPNLEDGAAQGERRERHVIVFPVNPPPDSNGTRRINELSCLSDPLTYPLMLPNGSHGWTTSLRLEPKSMANVEDENDIDAVPAAQDAAMRNRNGTVTARQFYAYRIQIRNNQSSVMDYGRLSQQYLVDQYAKIENFRLSWIENNQSNLRADTYVNIAEHGENGIVEQLGRQVVLPSSFSGGPRNMRQKFQDAMAMLRVTGNPDLFITMTANPNWPEVLAALRPGESPSDRPDLVARVFHIKLQALIKDIVTNNIFGRTKGHVYTIEYQKRGLPHAHIIVILENGYKILTPADVDSVVRAYIPDQQLEPELHAAVTKHMLHGPCTPASPCWDPEKKACRKNFPRDFCETTTMKDGTYPLYRRPETPPLNVRGNQTDNRYVVPYNPFLLLKYQCHINVEVCSGFFKVKYLFKYITKSQVEMTSAAISQRLNDNPDNEVLHFKSLRYIAPPEAVWGILAFPHHQISFQVERLHVHLDGEQSVVFDAEIPMSAEELARKSRTRLTAWFEMNSQHEDCRHVLYIDFPRFYTWNSVSRTWKKRINGMSREIVGRMYAASPSQGERFYLRLLLCHVPGAQSFEHLRTVMGTVHSTFRAACFALGLLDSDDEWVSCMHEAVHSVVDAKQIRALFCLILRENAVSDPPTLYLLFRRDLAADYIHHCARRLNVLPEELSDAALSPCFNSLLLDIENRLRPFNKTLTLFGLPEPDRAGGDVDERDAYAYLFASATSYDQEEQLHIYLTNLESANLEQRQAIEMIVNAINDRSDQAHTFFLCGPGGSGKTFVYLTILAYVRSRDAGQNIAFAWASSGLAATLLPGGSTAHSGAGIPVPTDPDSVLRIGADSARGRLLTQSSLIVWDEAGMSHRDCTACVSRSLQDFTQCVSINGSKVVIYGGDFRQALPVVRNSNRAMSVNATLLAWPLFRDVIQIVLTQNMRVSRMISAGASPEQIRMATNFADFLLALGDGRVPTHRYTRSSGPNDIILLPQAICLPRGASVHHLIEKVFGPDNWDDSDYLGVSAILCPTNKQARMINDIITNEYLSDGEVFTFYSSDSIVNEDSGGDDAPGAQYPVEYLNTIDISGFPPHLLRLRIGSIIMCIRNLDTGVVNGSRFRVTHVSRFLIEGEHIVGALKGKRYSFSRLILDSSDSGLPFIFRRRQFPFIIAHAMTIHKSQGQTLSRVGMYLASSVFQHGLLYVAASRATNVHGLTVLSCDPALGTDAPFNAVRNVVYKEALLPPTAPLLDWNLDDLWAGPPLTLPRLSVERAVLQHNPPSLLHAAVDQ